MPAIGGGVNGLLHRAQKHGVDLLCIGPVFGGLGDGLEITRLGGLAQADTQAQGLDIRAQGFELFRRRAFVHAKQARVFALHDEVCAANIGRQHGFFNQAVGHIARARHNFFDTAILVTQNLRLGGFKVHRAALLPRFKQGLIDPMQMQKVRHQCFALNGFGAARVAQNRRHFGISKACMAPHHRRVKLVGLHRAIVGDKHVADHAQTVHFGVERAQTVGEFFRQHGDDPAREINAGGAIVSIDVDGGTVFHIMAHIGNRHQQTPAFGCIFTAPQCGRFAVHRIVKIARVFAINRH